MSFDAGLFNPAAFGTGYPALVAAIGQVRFPTIEVHISNSARRGPVSETARVSHGMVTGFGLRGITWHCAGSKTCWPQRNDPRRYRTSRG